MNKIRQFLALYTTNFWGVMNDNLLKILVMYIAVTWVNPSYNSIIVSATPGMLVLPYLFFSPLAGKLPMYCNKIKVIRISKIAELPIMILAIVAFEMQSVVLALTSVLLMGLQSALFSPSKYGLIKDIGGPDGISQGMGGMEAVAFLGMLLGTVLASFMAELCSSVAIYATLLGLAVLGIICSFMLKVKEEKSAIDTSVNVIKFIISTNKLLRKYKGMQSIIHTLSLFWWLSATIQMVLILYCADTMNLTQMETGYILAAAAVGISLGCVAGGELDKRFCMLGCVPFIGFIIATLLIIIFNWQMPLIQFTIFIFLIAFVGGIFKIPLDSEIQKQVDASELNIVLAYFNQISFIYIFIASATCMFVTYLLPTRYVFLMLAIVFIVASIIFVFNYRTVLCFFGRTLMRLHYKIVSSGREKVNEDDGKNILILPAHRAVLDPLLLFAEMYDVKLQPLVDEGYFKIPVIGHILSLFDAVEVPDLQRGRAGVEKVRQLDSIIIEALNKNSNILFYPSGHITLDGNESIGARHLAYSTICNLPENTKVIGIRQCGLWGSQWSRYKKKSTPSIVKLLAKSLLLMIPCALHLVKKRKIELQYVDITEQVKEWSKLEKRDFNNKMEQWYNEGRFGEGIVIS